jgi:methionine biosynthesis protein MetW
MATTFPLSPDSHAAGFLDASVDPYRYDGHTADPDEVAGVIASMIPAGSRVLDVGCGTGSVTRIVRELCKAEIVGVEPDGDRARRATERGIDVHVGFLTPELIGRLGRFDFVVFADVLEHLADPLQMLELAKAALGKDGHVVASVPNIAHWSVRLDLLRGKFDYRSCGIMDATHLRWFTQKTARGLFTAAGYDVVGYRATAGLTLSDNVDRRPWRWIPAATRERMLRWASRRHPALFGCQHVIKARVIQRPGAE